MTDVIATALILAFGGLYPLVAPLVGTFGVFITGSDTTCAVLFGGLQYKAALGLGVEPSWILASNLAGASMGKMISVQSIVVGTGVSPDLVGREGEILKKTLGWGVAFSVLIGAITLAFAA
jgi:lactate permease